jgi:hypothetical protein
VATTPWRHKVTARPEVFACSMPVAGQLIVSIGQPDTNGAAYLADPILDRAVYVLEGTSNTPNRQSPFRLKLNPAYGSTPNIRLHPFALPHLYATEQVSLSVVVAVADLIGTKGGRLATYPITQECELLEMLHAERVIILLSTSFDLSVSR